MPFPGKPYPIGATWDIRGTNFALVSEHATKVELLLFKSGNDPQPVAVIPITEKTNSIWHCYLRNINQGQLYGYRVYGPYDPERGLRVQSREAAHRPLCKGAFRQNPVE